MPVLVFRVSELSIIYIEALSFQEKCLMVFNFDEVEFVNKYISDEYIPFFWNNFGSFGLIHNSIAEGSIRGRLLEYDSTAFNYVKSVINFDKN